MTLRERIEGLAASWPHDDYTYFGAPQHEIGGGLPSFDNRCRRCQLAAALVAEGLEPDKPFCFYNQEEDAIFMDGEKFARAAAPSLHKEGAGGAPDAPEVLKEDEQVQAELEAQIIEATWWAEEGLDLENWISPEEVEKRLNFLKNTLKDLRAASPAGRTYSPKGNFCSICRVHDEWCEHIQPPAGRAEQEAK